MFDCLHDMGDPVGAAKHAYESLKDDGTVLLVEPFANDTLDENITPVGRLFYAASTFICTPNSLSQEVGLGLGAQALLDDAIDIIDTYFWSEEEGAMREFFNRDWRASNHLDPDLLLESVLEI